MPAPRRVSERGPWSPEFVSSWILCWELHLSSGQESEPRGTAARGPRGGGEMAGLRVRCRMGARPPESRCVSGTALSSCAPPGWCL